MTLLIVLFSLVFIFGTAVGSFLNVCIWRLPRKESIVFPASHCPKCESPIRWHQNIPILSYLVLGGRCASCKAPISWRYPLVEALTGLLFVAVLYRFGLQWATPVYWLFVAALVAISFIDLDHQIIPNVITLPGILIGFSCSLLIPWFSWLDSLIGILVGGGILYLIAVAYELLARKEGMGLGDVKLLALIGAFLGWQGVLPVIFLSSLMGTLVGVPLMLVKKAGGKLAIPFGPFLALGALVWLLWGGGLFRWYLGLLQ